VSPPAGFGIGGAVTCYNVWQNEAVPLNAI
jgi:hypothetical protein